MNNDMEPPRKYHDCYFYYYSTCIKGKNCPFRHEPSALGSETMCAQWQQGKCTDKNCKLRHMELKKNRKQIPCYWENQPGGCRKKHCPFQHKNPEARTDGIAPIQPNNNAAQPTSPESALSRTDSETAPSGLVMHDIMPQHPVVLDSSILGVLPPSDMLRQHDSPLAPLSYPAHTVDPLVVNFDEESDNESVPSSTPTKNSSPPDESNGKNQELLLLERIQAETAALYSYDADTLPQRPRLPTLEPVLVERRVVRTNLNSKYERLSLDEISGRPVPDTRNSLDFKVLSLDEIRARKRASLPADAQVEPARKRTVSTHKTTVASSKVIKLVRSNSIVYKKVEQSECTSTTDVPETRKRTLSESNRELDDVGPSKNVAVKIRKTDETNEIKLRLRDSVSSKDESEQQCDTTVNDEVIESITPNVFVIDDDSGDNSVQEIIENKPIVLSDDDSLEMVEAAKLKEVTVDLSTLEDDSNDCAKEADNNLKSAIPDVVASCRNKLKENHDTSQEIIDEIDEILGDSS